MRHVGAVMTLGYSPDGSSLAVAHSWSCSLNVWDTSQWCRPMTTFPRVPHTPTAGGRGEWTGGGAGAAGAAGGEGGPVSVMAAVACLLWTQQGYRLLVAHNEVRQEDLLFQDQIEEGKRREGRRWRRCILRRERASASIVRYEMLKWARHAPLADTPLCLQGVNTIAFIEQRPWNPRLLCWAHVTIPPAYSVNVPVQLVAQSPSGEHLAVAGKGGLALYNRPQRRWRLFGNVHQERDLHVAGLTWWGEEAVVVVAKQRGRTTFEILLYPMHHLDNAALLSEPVALPPGTRPLFLECVEDRHGTAYRSRSQRRAPNSTSGKSSRSSRSSSVPSSFKDEQRCGTSLSVSGASIHSSGNDISGNGGSKHATSTSLDAVYWIRSAVLMVGDANFLLFYRLVRDHSPKGVSVSFIRDLKIPLHSGGATTAAPAPATAAAATAVTTSLTPGPVQALGRGETPRRIILLPNVSPRAVAVLSSTGSLYQVEIKSAVTTLIAKGVSSLWELVLPTEEKAMHPCYVLYCGEQGFSLWLPSLTLSEPKSLLLTREACQLPFLDPTFNPDVEGVIMGIHGPTSSLIFLTQSCIQPQASLKYAASNGGPPIPPRFEVGLQRRPIYQIAFRFLLFLQSMLLERKEGGSKAERNGGGGEGKIGGFKVSLSASSSTEECRNSDMRNGVEAKLSFSNNTATSAAAIAAASTDTRTSSNAAANAVGGVVAGVFDELYSQPETRIQLADALDFLLRSCIEALAKAHPRSKKQGLGLSSTSTTNLRIAEFTAGISSYFTSFSASTEQVKAALALCRREAGLDLFYEVIVRVARKIEPSRLKYIFPLPDLDEQGFGDTPVTLFEKCLATKKMHTALLYLPLIDPPGRDGGRGGGGGLLFPSTDRRARLLANWEEMQDLKLVHGLALRLLWEALRRGKKEWQMLKQLWRFIQKREEALKLYDQEARFLSEAGGGGRGCEAVNGSEGGSRSLVDLLYRATFGVLGAPSGAGSDVGGGGGQNEKGLSSAPASRAGSVNPISRPLNEFLEHLPGTVASVGAARGGGGGRGYGWMSEPDAPESNPSSSSSSSLADFDLLQHAGSGTEVLTLFASMCLATLRLRELVDSLLLLGGGDLRRVPFPSLQPWMSPGTTSFSSSASTTNSTGSRNDARKWQQHAWTSSQWPWARFEAPSEVVLDTFLAIREQFATASPSGAAAAATAATTATEETGRRKKACTVEERLSILGRICVELRDYECLLAVGTFSKDVTTVTAALKRSKLRIAEYRTIFLDEGMEAGGVAVKDFVEKSTTPLLVVGTVVGRSS